MLGDRAEAQSGRWVIVGKTADTTYYLDSSVVATSNKDVVEAWTKLEFLRTIPARDGNTYDSRVTRYMINCRKATWRSTETVHLRSAMLVRRWSSTGMPAYRSPRPQEKALIELACLMSAK